MHSFQLFVKACFIRLNGNIADRIDKLNGDKLLSTIIGPFSLIFITFLTTTIILGLYLCIVKWKSQDWPIWRFAAHWIAAHVVAFNICYHFYQAAFSDPGCPSDEIAVGFGGKNGWCRKCSVHKPPLTHHCSVCRRCVLRMDHHCTWMNNCIGLHNHRHFFLFCFFMCFATLYAYISGSQLYSEHTLYGYGYSFGHPDNGSSYSRLGLFIFDCRTNQLTRPMQILRNSSETSKIIVRQTVNPFRSGNRVHRFVYIGLNLCLLFSVLLAVLMGWHSWLISIGHTSIDNLGGASKDNLEQVDYTMQE